MRALLAVGLLFLAGAEARADPFVDKVAALTGVETPETQAIDREVTDLIEAYQKANAKWLAEPVGRTKGKLLAEADNLRKQALERARAAATLRAEAANQRCLAPDAGGSAAGGETSPYLCGAVGGAKPGDVPNDPWTVCGCARRYIEGLRAEVEAITQRAPALVGQSWPTQRAWSLNFKFWRSAPLPADLVAGYFDSDLVAGTDTYIGRVGSRGTGGEGGWSFFTLAKQAQEHIAQHDVYERTSPNAGGTGQPAFSEPALKEAAVLVPAVREAYFRVQEALRWAWLLTQREGAFKMAAIEERLVEALERAEKPFNDREGAIHNAILSDQNRTWQEQQADIRAADQKACPGWVAEMMPAIEEAVAAARAVTADVYKARRRYLADAEAWKVFGLKDGAGSGPSTATGHQYNDEDFAQFITANLGLWDLPFGSGLPDDPLIDDKLETGWILWLPDQISQDAFGPFCMWPAFFMTDPIAGYWIPEDESNGGSDPGYGYWLGNPEVPAETYDALVLKAAQSRFPEMEVLSGGAALLRFQLERQGQRSEAVVSGAGVDQGP